MNTKRLAHTAVLGLAFAALAAPAADARQDLRNPDQVAPPAEVRQDLRHPDTIDAAAGRGTDRSPGVVVIKLPAAAPSAARPDNVDWQDVGIGAGGLFAFGLIGLGGTLVVMHRRHHATTTPAGLR